MIFSKKHIGILVSSLMIFVVVAIVVIRTMTGNEVEGKVKEIEHILSKVESFYEFHPPLPGGFWGFNKMMATEDGKRVHIDTMIWNGSHTYSSFPREGWYYSCLKGLETRLTIITPPFSHVPVKKKVIKQFYEQQAVKVWQITENKDDTISLSRDASCFTFEFVEELMGVKE